MAAVEEIYLNMNAIASLWRKLEKPLPLGAIPI